MTNPVPEARFSNTERAPEAPDQDLKAQVAEHIFSSLSEAICHKETETCRSPIVPARPSMPIWRAS